MVYEIYYSFIHICSKIYFVIFFFNSKWFWTSAVEIQEMIWHLFFVVNKLMFYYLRGLALLHQIKVWWGHQNYTEKSIIYWPVHLYGLCRLTYLSYELPLRCKQLITKSLQNNVFHKVFFRTCCLSCCLSSLRKYVFP